jgi:hypothetical protein
MTIKWNKRRRLAPEHLLSALLPKTDITENRRHVCFVPEADICFLNSAPYWPPKIGSDTRATGGGFHLPVSASDLGA